jgi:hypothetical protein
MSKIVKQGPGLYFEQHFLVGKEQKAIEAINESLKHVLWALAQSVGREQPKVNFPACIKLEMETSKWDGHIKATLEWSDGGGFWNEYQGNSE